MEGLTSPVSAPESAAAAPSPYEAPELYDLLFEALDFDRAFWLEVGRGARGPVLDLGCGTGRILIPLLEAGVDAASHRFEARQRWVYRYELELLLRLAGFPRWEIQGDFAGGPLERDDQQMIAWAWREPS